MNKSFYILFLFCFLSHNFWTQENLVPNPSFEELDSCEQIGGFSENGIIDWYNPTAGTSDMFNGCSDFSVPENSLGWQEARTGIGYAGLIPYEDIYFEGQTGWFIDSREYIQVELKEPLFPNGVYNITFYVSLADTYATCANSGIGAYVSMVPINSIIPWALLDYPAQVASYEVLNDSIGWSKVSGNFIAEGEERFLTIGCFEHDDEIDIQCISDTVFERYAYYYIDDVSINLESINYDVLLPNIITPNHDGENDFLVINLVGYIGLDIRIFNRWGTQVFHSNQLDFEWDNRALSDGVYFYQLQLERVDHSLDSKNGFVQLVR